jgi:glycosyltransferase involved in cell wall biosynthesis
MVITGHFSTPVPVMALTDFLKDKTKELILIRHPFVFNKHIGSSMLVYGEGNAGEEKFFYYPKVTSELALYSGSLLITLKWLLFRPASDIFIGIGNIDAFCGIILKKFKKVKKVIFYAIDFVPQRFPNKCLNKVYHLLDNYVVRNADFIWNLSSLMVEMREKKGITPKYRNKQITVPIGTNINVSRKPFSEVRKNTIAFIGHLREYQGLELLIDSLALVKEKVPGIKLILIGDGPLRELLKEKAKRLGLGSNIEFTGFIADNSKAEEMLSFCSLGLAPYEDKADNFVRYTDPGKVKAYVAVGLPVVITKVPQVAYELEKERCGIAVTYDKQEFAAAIARLLSDENMLREYRDNAFRFAQRYSWDKVFSQAFEVMPC